MQGAKPGGQLVDGDRLRQKVVGPRVQAGDPLLHALAGRQDQDRQRQPAGPPAAQPDHAVHARQPEIEHHGIDGRAVECSFRVGAVARPLDLVSQLPQGGGQGVTQQSIVLDDQQAHGTGSPWR